MTKEIIIEKLYFKRTILHIEGVCTQTDQEKDLRFVLWDKDADHMLDIEECRWDDNAFFIRINTMELEDEHPISSGKYRLHLCDSGNMKAAILSDSLKELVSEPSPEPYTVMWDTRREETGVVETTIYPTKECDLRADRINGNHWHGFSGFDNETGEYILDVDFVYEFKDSKRTIADYVHPYKLFRRFIEFSYTKIFNYYNNKPKTGKKILFTSDRSSNLSGNEKCIYDRLIQRGFDKEYEFSFEFKDGIKSRRSFKDKLSFAKNFATADYIFVDDYQPELYKIDFKPEVKIIQLWHACGAFKTIGFERLSGNGAPPLMTKVHKCYTHVTVSSDHSADHNAEAFAIKRSKFYPVGVARTDMFFDRKIIEETKEKIFKDHPELDSSKKIILYSPTFRGINARDAYFPFEMMDLEKIGATCEKTDSLFLIKMHPFVKQSFDIPEQYSHRIFDYTSFPDINQLMMVVDIIVTDYSSMIYEAGLLHLPMLFYAFDYDDYDTDRGFYEPFEDIVPGKIVKTMDELITALENQDYEKEKLEGFLKKNFKYLDGKSTDRTIDLIFSRP